MYKLFSTLIAILLLSGLFVGYVTNSAAIQASTSDTHPISADSDLVGVSVDASNMKHIIFRDDDIAPWSRGFDVLKGVNQVHIDKNVPVTLGLIAHPNPQTNDSDNELLADTPKLSYFQSLATNPLFEIAQHGYSHHSSKNTFGPGEFGGRPYTEQYNAIKQGRNDITEALGVTPTTFIPPFDKGDDNTLKACAALGFTLYSTGWGDFGINETTMQGITVQAASFSIGWDTTTEWQTGMASLKNDTDTALNSTPAGKDIVVSYHYWQFSAADGSLDPTRIALFEQYIDHLKSRGDVQFTTLNNQNGLPLSAKTQLNLTASSTISAIDQPVAFTATLFRLDPATTQWIAVGSSKPIQIWHTLNGVRYNDMTIDTDDNSQITFMTSLATSGNLTYYASFPGDSSYIASTSSPMTIIISSQTETALAAWGIIPSIT